MTVRTKHNVELRDIRAGELVVSHNCIEEGRSYVAAEHTSARLPIEFLSLFTGGTVAADELTAEERDWITAESCIEFPEVAH